MRQSVFSLIFLMSAICSFIVNGMALSEEMEVKETKEVQTEMLDDNTNVQVENKLPDTQASDNKADEYTVQKGDTLSEIAKSTLGSEDKWPLIAKINHLNNPDELYVGQKLKLPTDAGTKDMKVDENKNQAKQDADPYHETSPEIAGTEEGDMKVSESSETDKNTDSTITGQIESSRRDSNTLIITDENGDSHEFKLSSPDVLNGVKKGDTVEVEFQDGKAASVVQKDIPDKQSQMKD